MNGGVAGVGDNENDGASSARYADSRNNGWPAYTRVEYRKGGLAGEIPLE